MENLTEKQVELIEQIKSEFNKINNSGNENKGKFNLVDTNTLTDLVERKRKFREEEKAKRHGLEQLRNEEAQRIADLLREDLPTAFIDVSRGIIFIRPKKYSDPVCLYIDTVTYKRLNKELEEHYEVFERLIYRFYHNPNATTSADSIEELFANEKLQRQIRDDVIAKL